MARRWHWAPSSQWLPGRPFAGSSAGVAVGLRLGFFAPASGPGCFLEVSVRVGNFIQSGVVS